MNNRWDSAEVDQYSDELEELAYAVRLLNREEGNILNPGGSASLKRLEKNCFGEDEEIIYIDPAEWKPEMIGAGSFIPLRRQHLSRLARAEGLTEEQRLNEIACCRKTASSPIPPPESLLHAALPYRAILLAQPTAFLSVACAKEGLAYLREIYGNSVLLLPYVRRGAAAAQACLSALESLPSPDLEGIYIDHLGLLVFGENPQAAYQKLVRLETLAEQFLTRQGACYLAKHAAEPTAKPVGHELAALRKAISELAGFPLILRQCRDAEMTGLCQQEELSLFDQPPAVSRDICLFGAAPLIGKHLEEYTAAHPSSYPRVILDAEFGLCCLGYTAEQAASTESRFLQWKDILLRTTALGGYRAMPPEAVPLLLESCPPRPDDSSALFMGEVALVTGGASGIGKACVESLLARGAAVVSMDINPKVTTLYHRADYLGLQIDLTDEQAVIGGFEELARVFGGLDMLVLNAGIFPAGVRIESLSLEEWRRVMRINLDPNLVVLREAHPLLKQSPKGGRVLVNASKNVLAPGAGAAAYSSSKAAVTQMARVAALEWGKDRIRVNMIHPDAIFDTGIWTEEVLKARAAHYGMTVQQYKTRNVLGVELNSHYVGELVAEMLGPRFEKITGAQIPVDGGSDRVI